MTDLHRTALFNESQRHHVSAERPLPLYHQLYTFIKNFILDGTLHHAERLPSEIELAEIFNVSRITVKRAVNELAAEQLVERARGKGTHVIYKYTPKPVQAPLLGILQEIDSIAADSVAEIISCSLALPPQSIRSEFAIDRNAQLFHLVRKRERAGAFFGYFESWTAWVKMPSTTDIFIHESRHKYFRENGTNVSHVKQNLSAVAASEAIAAHLHVPVGSPLLSLVRLSYSQNGDREELVDHLLALYNPELFQYQMDMKLE